MTIDDDPTEPETLPEEIVHWQPNSRPLVQAHAGTLAGSSATGSAAVGALAVGALALGALAIGTLVIGRLSVGRARFRRLELDELVVRKLTLPRGGWVPR